MSLSGPAEREYAGGCWLTLPAAIIIENIAGMVDLNSFLVGASISAVVVFTGARLMHARSDRPRTIAGADRGPPSPARSEGAMEPILQEIEAALAAKLYYVALGATLTLPDVCAALEAPDGQTSGKRYRAWYEANLQPAFPWLTGDDCYSLRCGVLHQGRFGGHKMQYARVIFNVSPAARFNNCVINDAFFNDAEGFCRRVIEAVRAWYRANESSPTIKANLPRLVRLHPGGLAPYLEGLPVIG